MHRLLILLLLLAASGCTMISSPSRAVRVLTYNIHAGKDAQLVDNLDRVAAIIDSTEADIVLLQEVDRRTQRAHRVDHFAELRTRTRMHGVFGKSITFQGGDYGIAVLSRWPIDSIAAVPLLPDPSQERSSYETRIVLHVLVRTPGGPLHVVNTHLDAAANPSFRRQELIAALAHMKQNVPTDAPVVFGGDLNARPVTSEIAAIGFSLADVFDTCGAGSAETFPAHAPDRRIDYIFFRYARCQTARVIATQASDHRPRRAIMAISGVR